MKTKSSIILLLVATCLLSIASCKKVRPTPAHYTIEGATDSILNGKTVYLYDYGSGRKLDSVLVDSNKFVFKGIVDTIRFCQINIGRPFVDLIIDTGTIIVDLKGHNASGNILNEKLAEYNKQIKDINEERGNVYNELKEQYKDEAKLRSVFDSIYRNVWRPKYINLLDKSIEANADNIIGAIVLSEMSMSYRTGQMDTAIAKLSKDIATLALAERTIERNETLKKTAEGQKFTDFTIDQPDGTKASLSDYAGKGKYVLVDFWASWCGPCRGETPNLKELYEKYKGDKFEIVGVVVWDRLEDTQKAIEEDKMTWPQILDAKEIPTKLYGINGIPHIMLIGPDGTIIARNLRGDQMKKEVAKELAK